MTMQPVSEAAARSQKMRPPKFRRLRPPGAPPQAAPYKLSLRDSRRLRVPYVSLLGHGKKRRGISCQPTERKLVFSSLDPASQTNKLRQKTLLAKSNLSDFGHSEARAVLRQRPRSFWISLTRVPSGSTRYAIRRPESSTLGACRRGWPRWVSGNPIDLQTP